MVLYFIEFNSLCLYVLINFAELKAERRPYNVDGE